jgi:hypothetical protein
MNYIANAKQYVKYLFTAREENFPRNYTKNQEKKEENQKA